MKVCMITFGQALVSGIHAGHVNADSQLHALDHCWMPEQNSTIALHLFTAALERSLGFLL